MILGGEGLVPSPFTSRGQTEQLENARVFCARAVFQPKSNGGLPGLLECSRQGFGAAAWPLLLRRLQPRSVLLRFVEAKVAVLADSGLLRPSAPLRNRPEHAVRAPRAEQ